jgi:hypothetical protein
MGEKATKIPFSSFSLRRCGHRDECAHRLNNKGLLYYFKQRAS